jgi:hypothetical protein
MGSGSGSGIRAVISSIIGTVLLVVAAVASHFLSPKAREKAG